MNQDFSKLSYKELQALAAQHQIPGNIKKNVLVDILGALKCGDELQVNRILVEVKENRKRKVRKRKQEKLTPASSTPLHSPNYSSIDDRFYSPQHLSPYRWAPPDEEMREDSHYDIFRQYLIQKIQKGYTKYDANNNNDVANSALNLKANPIELSLRPNVLDTSSTPNLVVSSSLPVGYHAGSGVESQAVNDSNEDNYRPMILQKMLQAPLGTNLGAMARLEANRMWPSEQYCSSRELWENNSDTITAGSESNDEIWEERTDYYNQTQLPQFTLEQMMNFFQASSQNGYHNSNQFNYVQPNVQENCQSWIENNSMDYKGPMNYVETTDSSRMFTSYPGVEQPNYQNETVGNFSVFEQTHPATNQSEIPGMHVQNMDSYYYQWPAQQFQPYRPDYYDHTHFSNVLLNNAQCSTNITQQFTALQTQDSNEYVMYPQECVTLSRSGAEQLQYSMSNVNQHYQSVHTFTSNLVEPSNGNKTDDQSNLKPIVNKVQKEGNNSLDPYWPKWSENVSGGFHLQNILNLQTGSAIDYSKFNQTSTVYCFAPPLVNEISGISSSQNIAHAELVTAKRQHTFTPNSLVYSDSTTGMQMANLTSEIRQRSEEKGSDESFITSEYISSVESHHREPIQEIWIRDCSNHYENESNDYLSSSYETIPE